MTGSARDSDLTTVLRGLDDDGRLVHVERFSERVERHAELERPLPPRVSKALGVDRFWTHQAEAIDHLREGTSVALATGTASGKSLVYQTVIAEALTTSVPPATALLLFPTKALAQDQARALADLGLPELKPACYDADASREERAWIRENAKTILTNPEMLHHGMLPNHKRWATFLMRLRYVVIDELHVFKGVFGSHLAQVLRRLRRLCRRNGSDPTFVFTSATIGEPARLASSLAGVEVANVSDDGSPRAVREFALWNPPALDASGARVSPNVETARIAAALVERGRRTIVFCASRKATELVAADLRRRLPTHLANSVRPYRGGYLPEERREIERELFSGELRAVVATTALELGIDIGGLDACVLNGFPGTIASLWQQAGRAGRRGVPSMSVLVAGDDQLDQWFMRHPRQMFERSPEPSVINPSNPFVLLPHLSCAAHESPLSLADADFWPDDLDEGVRHLVQGDELSIRTRVRPGGTEPVGVWMGTGWPSRQVSLRSASSGEVRIVDTTDDDRLIGTIDLGRACSVVHPGAIYLHRGTTYEIDDLDLDTRRALAVPADGKEYSRSRSSTEIRVLGTDIAGAVGRAGLFLGTVEVSTEVSSYQRLNIRTRAVVEDEPLDLPTQTLLTRAVWYTVDADTIALAGVDENALPGTLHAVEHAAIGMLPLFAICDRWDVGGVSTPFQIDTLAPSIFIYDGFAGGAGVAELAHASADRHLAATLESIEACPCDTGCPSCVQSPKCGNGNDPLDKAGATRLLAAILRP